MSQKKLFTDGESSTKIAKSNLASLEQFVDEFLKEFEGIETKILYMAPAMESGRETCSSRSDGCTKSCLYTAGRGRFDATKRARIERTKLFFEHREEFKTRILKEVGAFVRRCLKLNKLPAVRMNGTSDIPFERLFPELFTEFPTVKFYDYTKHVARMSPNYELPQNYHLTFSKSEANLESVKKVLNWGKNVAVVFDGMPTEYLGFPVFDGDETDLRFLDPDNHVIGLKAKGDAKKDNSGFVVRQEVTA
jgi:hypothetical protein